jgi:oligoendopeptidase F
MKRSEVKEEFKWRKEDIFLSEGEWERQLSVLNKERVGILRFKGRLGAKTSLLECFDFSDDCSQRLEKLYCYAMLYRDENLSDAKAAALKAKIETLLVQFNTYSSFITPELSALDEVVLNGFINDAAFTAYEYRLKTVLKQKKHILSEGEERILALAGKTAGAFREIFGQIDNVDLPFPTIKVDGKSQKLTHGLFGLLLHSRDRDLRKRVFNGMYRAFESVINTIAATFSASVNKDNFLAAARGYESALHRSLAANDVPASVYNTLVAETGKRLNILHSYMAYRKLALGVDELHFYDLHVPLFENAEISAPFSKAYDLGIDGLKPMGEEYSSLLRQARQNRWIDVEETENKRSGAYSLGVYGVHPYVLLNYQPTTHDVFTIAHEMGHAVHSFYSSKFQPYAKNDYSIFVAEVASTVNEVLLLKHLLSAAKDRNTKRFLLSYYLDMFRTTLFRQTMFAEFEETVHSLEASGVPLTVDGLSKVYGKLNKKYYGQSVVYDRQIKYEWARIPHFYGAYYVYQYATGITSAVNIANAILREGKPAFLRYKTFLCAGGGKSPYEILKDAGVDLNSSHPYDVAFGEFETALRDLKDLC